MKRKGWFIPIAVFFVCTWFLILYEQSTNEPYLAHTSNLAQLPWDKDISEIQQVHFAAHSSSFTAERINNEWFITAPIQSVADSTYVYNVISQFISPGLIHTIETEVTDPSSYGIYDYSPKITLVDENGAEYTLIAGNAASDITYYAYSPLTKCIYTIKKEIFDFVMADLSFWRTKDYISFNPEQTAKIEITTSDTHYVLEPVSIEGSKDFYSQNLSQKEVEYFISLLSTSKVEQFIVDNASEHIISSYGFNKPNMKIKIYDFSGNAMTFSFVKIPDSSSFYVLDHSKNSIYKVFILNS